VATSHSGAPFVETPKGRFLGKQKLPAQKKFTVKFHQQLKLGAYDHFFSKDVRRLPNLGG